MFNSKPTLRNIFKDRRLNRENTKRTLLFLVFLLISFVFWLFLTLNNTIQQDFPVKIEITGIPDSTTIVTEYPEYVNVSVKDKGVALLKYLLGDNPKMEIKFKDYAGNKDNFVVPATEFRRLVRNLFDNTTTILGMSLETLNLKYTELPGKLVPVRLDLDIRPNIQYVIYGPIHSSVDSVRIYSDRSTLASIDEVYTYHVEERELTDTLVRDVSISPIPGVKVKPNIVKLTIPVEPLIMKKQNIPVRVKNVPQDINVLTFPSMVEVSFLVPFSAYRKNSPMVAIADFEDINTSISKKMPIRIEEFPALYNNLSLAIDSVEYIIEKR